MQSGIAAKIHPDIGVQNVTIFILATPGRYMLCCRHVSAHSASDARADDYTDLLDILKIEGSLTSAEYNGLLAKHLRHLREAEVSARHMDTPRTRIAAADRPHGGTRPKRPASSGNIRSTRRHAGCPRTGPQRGGSGPGKCRCGAAGSAIHAIRDEQPQCRAGREIRSRQGRHVSGLTH